MSCHFEGRMKRRYTLFPVVIRRVFLSVFHTNDVIRECGFSVYHRERSTFYMNLNQFLINDLMSREIGIGQVPDKVLPLFRLQEAWNEIIYPVSLMEQYVLNLGYKLPSESLWTQTKPCHKVWESRTSLVNKVFSRRVKAI